MPSHETDSVETKVYILGAGCSVCGGYPVAKDVAGRLREFAESNLQHPGANELKRCVDRTYQLLKEHNVETVDALARILQPKHSKAIREAKIAMSVLLFGLEDQATDEAFPSYAAFFEDLFRYGRGGNPSLEERLEATPCRVLTFNYDRLFERTFLKWAAIEDPTNTEIAKSLSAFLNIDLGEPVTFRPERFSLIKLHGGIGQFNRIGGPNAFGQSRHLFWPGYAMPVPPFNDEPYYKRKDYDTNEPTIIFPHEKRNGDEPTESGGRSFFQGYDNAVWREAGRVCSQAREIHIIGYSIQSIDYFWFKTLIAEAKNCRRIVLRNRFSERERLEARLLGIREEFNRRWDVEYRNEEFFGKRETPINAEP